MHRPWRLRLAALLVLGLSVATPAGAIEVDAQCLDTPAANVAVHQLECSIPLGSGLTEWRMKVHDGFEPDASFRVVLADGTLAAKQSCYGRYYPLSSTVTFGCYDDYFAWPYHIRTWAGFWRDGLEMGGVVDLPAGGGTLIVSGRGTGPITARTA
jgi:hypothetical protein